MPGLLQQRTLCWRAAAAIAVLAGSYRVKGASGRKPLPGFASRFPAADPSAAQDRSRCRARYLGGTNAGCRGSAGVGLYALPTAPASGRPRRPEPLLAWELLP